MAAVSAFLSSHWRGPDGMCTGCGAGWPCQPEIDRRVKARDEATNAGVLMASKTYGPADKKSDVPPRVALLNEAAEIIDGDRNKSYGTPTQNFQNIANMWNVQFGHKTTEPFSASDVAQAMALVKLSRMIASNTKDNWLDLAGYAACGYECSQEETE